MDKLDKIRIIAYKDGVPLGYIKSTSYSKGTFSLTRDKMFAKTYAKQERAMYDIDFATGVGYMQGYIFSMDT